MWATTYSSLRSRSGIDLIDSRSPRSIKHVFPDPGSAVEPGSETGGKWGESQAPFEGVCCEPPWSDGIHGREGMALVSLWSLSSHLVRTLYLSVFYHLRRRSPCHARGADQLRGHVDLLRGYYNFIRPHRALKFGRETRTPAMQAGLVSAPMNWSDIFTAPAPLGVFFVAVVRIPVTVQLMKTSAAALPAFSWPHEHRSAA